MTRSTAVAAPATFGEASSRIATVRVHSFAGQNVRRPTPARVAPCRRRLESGPSPLNDAEAGNIAAKVELLARENRVRMPVRRIVQAQLSRRSNFVAMLGT
jgi:hypothetical protein